MRAGRRARGDCRGWESGTFGVLATAGSQFGKGGGDVLWRIRAMDGRVGRCATAKFLRTLVLKVVVVVLLGLAGLLVSVVIHGLGVSGV